MTQPTLPRVRDFMTTRVRSLTPGMPILKAVDMLIKQQISGAPVVEGDTVVGVLSEKDCLKLVSQGVAGEVAGGTVSDYMTKEVECIPPSMDIYYVAGLFLRNAYRRYPVVDEDSKLVGVISRHDVLKAIQKIRKKPAPGTGRFTRMD